MIYDNGDDIDSWMAVQFSDNKPKNTMSLR
jgi:hypothetical protein